MGADTRNGIVNVVGIWQGRNERHTYDKHVDPRKKHDVWWGLRRRDRLSSRREPQHNNKVMRGSSFDIYLRCFSVRMYGLGLIPFSNMYVGTGDCMNLSGLTYVQGSTSWVYFGVFKAVGLLFYLSEEASLT